MHSKISMNVIHYLGVWIPMQYRVLLHGMGIGKSQLDNKSNLYHIETVNYNSILCKLFWHNM